ncbi:MAG: tol-pal system protein YbgF [Candidatus Cloacimonadota bacterium]|nr:MAG: tol-pal system protein YbgF [Candidatus Cloacimonadota bacterium]
MLKFLAVLCPFLFWVSCSSNKESVKENFPVKQRIEDIEMNVSDNSMRIRELNKLKEYSDTDRLTLRIEKLEHEVQLLKNLKFEAESDSQSESDKNFVIDTLAVQNSYAAAREAYLENDFDKAIRLFRAFTAKYPEDKLTANCQYWIGECYYDRNSYNSAIDEFQRVIDYYPTSPKAPDSQLKIGLCYKKLGRLDQAKLELKRIKRYYPGYERQELVDKIIREMR